MAAVGAYFDADTIDGLNEITDMAVKKACVPCTCCQSRKVDKQQINVVRWNTDAAPPPTPTKVERKGTFGFMSMGSKAVDEVNDVEPTPPSVDPSAETPAPEHRSWLRLLR